MNGLLLARKMTGISGTMAVILATGVFQTGCGNHGGKGGPPQRVPEVATVVIQQEPVVITAELPGRTTAFRVAEIRPQVSGLIQKRLFVEGSVVEAGQVLYQIDPAPFEAAMNSAKASLARAEAALLGIKLRAERYGALIAEKAVSQQDFDDAAAAVKQVEAEIGYWRAAVEVAGIHLAYTSVKAPISGRIGKSSVTDGALVTAFQPVALATIQQLDPMYVDVPQSSTELLRMQRRIQEGRLSHDAGRQDRVKLVLSDGTPYAAEGTLQFQDVTVDPTTGSVILRAVFPNADNGLLPGMFVRAVIIEGVNGNAILVPQQSVTRNPKGDPLVWIVDAESKMQQRMIAIDRALGNRWLVASGLAPGDRVVVEGAQKARPGALVKAVPFEGGMPEGSGVQGRDKSAPSN